MPMRTPAAIALTEVNTYRIERWWVDLLPTEKLTCQLMAGLADQAGTVSVWTRLPDLVLEGAALNAAWAEAARQISLRTPGPLPAPADRAVAFRQGLQAALYQAAQAGGQIPVMATEIP